jgi:hypothetical protein
MHRTSTTRMPSTPGGGTWQESLFFMVGRYVCVLWVLHRLYLAKTALPEIIVTC